MTGRGNWRVDGESNNRGQRPGAGRTCPIDGDKRVDTHKRAAALEKVDWHERVDARERAGERGLGLLCAFPAAMVYAPVLRTSDPCVVAPTSTRGTNLDHA